MNICKPSVSNAKVGKWQEFSLKLFWEGEEQTTIPVSVLFLRLQPYLSRDQARQVLVHALRALWHSPDGLGPHGHR